jgi:hypothetical protein
MRATDVGGVYSEYALRGGGDTGDKSIATHLIDTVHAIVSPVTYMYKSAADGMESAIETGTREVTQGIGAAIVVVSDRAAEGVADAIVESSRLITLAVVWAIAGFAVTVLAHYVLAHYVLQLRARNAALARLVDANAEHEDASDTLLAELQEEVHAEEIKERDAHDPDVQPNQRWGAYPDPDLQADVDEMLLLHELLRVARTHDFRERKAAVKRLLAHEGVHEDRLAELYARVRTNADIDALCRELTPPAFDDV